MKKCKVCGDTADYFIDNNGLTVYFCGHCIDFDILQTILEEIDIEIGEYDT